MMTNKGKLYLIPSPLGDNQPSEVLPEMVFETIGRIRTYVVEEVRTARRFLSRAGLKGKIDTLEFHELNEHTSSEQIEGYLGLFERGEDIGKPDSLLWRTRGRSWWLCVIKEASKWFLLWVLRL